MNLVNRRAPNIVTPAVLGNDKIIIDYNLHTAIRDKYGLVFFYPMDWTFVCPSELLALNHRYGEFSKRNVEVVTVSVDSVPVHKAWRDRPIDDGGIGKVQFTMASDVTHHVMKSYYIEYDTSPVALRAAFIIDKYGIIRASVINDLPIGRDIDYILSLFDATIEKDKNIELE